MPKFKITSHDALNIVGGIMIGWGLAQLRKIEIVEIHTEPEAVDVFIANGEPLMTPNYRPSQFYCPN